MLWLCSEDADLPQAVYGNIMEKLTEDGTFNLRIRSHEKFFMSRDVNDIMF